MNPLLIGMPLLLAPHIGWWAFLATIAAKWLRELMAIRFLRGAWLDIRWWIALPLKDILMPLLLLRGAFVSRVSWRGKSFRMHDRSVIIPIAHPAPSDLFGEHGLARKERLILEHIRR